MVLSGFVELQHGVLRDRILDVLIVFGGNGNLDEPAGAKALGLRNITDMPACFDCGPASSCVRPAVAHNVMSATAWDQECGNLSYIQPHIGKYLHNKDAMFSRRKPTFPFLFALRILRRA